MYFSLNSAEAFSTFLPVYSSKSLAVSARFLTLTITGELGSLFADKEPAFLQLPRIRIVWMQRMNTIYRFIVFILLKI